MSESDLASQLIEQGAASAADPTAFAALAVKKHRGRIRLLASATIVLWVLAVLVIPAFFAPAIGLVEQQMHDVQQLDQAHLTPEYLAGAMAFLFGRLSVAAAWIMAVSLLTSLLAAICTVWLVLTVRRITLEQVSAGLTQISEQLRRLEENPRRSE